ncbi:MAG: hypothetical protein JWN95_3767 [Frankiales bacterium]|nr:hypothetical protein [Frankiales bacterium]
MAMPRRINIEFGEVFPYGAFVVSEVTPLRDFDRSTKDKPVQMVDPDTGLLLWSVDVIDPDPEARKAERQFSVRIAAKVSPVLPASMPEAPFKPVEFEGLTATAYVAQQGDSRPRLAWSFRATDLHAPRSSKSASSPAAA